MYKHKKKLAEEKVEKEVTIGITAGVVLTFAAVGLGMLLSSGGKRKN
jgi:hypothetical protein